MIFSSATCTAAKKSAGTPFYNNGVRFNVRNPINKQILLWRDASINKFQRKEILTKSKIYVIIIIENEEKKKKTSRPE